MGKATDDLRHDNGFLRRCMTRSLITMDFSEARSLELVLKDSSDARVYVSTWLGHSTQILGQTLL